MNMPASGGSESPVLNAQLQQAVRQIEQVHRFQALVHQLTSKCWDVCVDKPSNRLGSSTETCLKNCAGRFVDTSNFVANRLDQIIGKSNVDVSSFD